MSDFWGFAPGTVKVSDKKPDVKPVYGSLIRRLYDWPKRFETTFYFEVKEARNERRT